MQCPACKHESAAAAFGDPLRCPECGAYYEKAIWHSGDKLDRAAHDRVAAERQVTRPIVGGEHVQKIAGQNKGAQPVVVVDLHMSFNSMVWFMVKWAIAAIPAMIILAVIGFLIVMLLGGLAGLGAK
ncbi:hypothetical protein [Pseudomonas sp. ML96]|uniref:hypothetical protein n=1 Tax=Pseudomonas sp. ML96 TaxID=1523503 RepID=UPI0012DFECB3|nr:hypothetical protein [Pseudomonas sp. ML96]